MLQISWIRNNLDYSFQKSCLNIVNVWAYFGEVRYINNRLVRRKSRVNLIVYIFCFENGWKRTVLIDLISKNVVKTLRDQTFNMFYIVLHLPRKVDFENR